MINVFTCLVVFTLDISVTSRIIILICWSDFISWSVIWLAYHSSELFRFYNFHANKICLCNIVFIVNYMISILYRNEINLLDQFNFMVTDMISKLLSELYTIIEYLRFRDFNDLSINIDGDWIWPNNVYLAKCSIVYGCKWSLPMRLKNHLCLRYEL